MRLSILIVLVSFFAVAAQAKQDLVKDPKGKTLAVIQDCSTCKDEQGKDCVAGKETGYSGGADCGQCLLEANFGTRIGYPYDVHIVGKLKDETGKPMGNKFVQVSLPNTWRIRTRTQEDGSYRIMLGATLPKAKSTDLLVVDLGTRTMPSTEGSAGQYSLFMLQDGYKACSKDAKDKAAKAKN
jgi:hypothetical protein